MADQQFDLDIVVIGGGPGGYPAAIHAAKHGARVAIIDFDNVGGTCLNWGCIPTKTMIGSVAALQQAKHASDFGLTMDNVGFNFDAVMARKDKIVTTLVGGVEFLLTKKNKVRYIKGKGKIIDANTVEATLENGSTERVTTASIIIATGSVPSFIPIPGLDGGGKDSDVFFANDESKKRKAAGTLGDTAVWTSNEAVSSKEVPKRLVILGAGAVGTEFAYVYNGLGSEVTLVELLPNIVPVVDPEISGELRKLLEKQGIKIMTGTKVTAVDVAARKLKYSSEKGDGELEFDKLLVAVGRSPYTDGLGLESVGIKIERRRVAVDEYMRTSVANIYAIGDVTGGKLALAHVATREGEVAADNALGHPTKMDYRGIPAAVYTEPEVAVTGLTEQEAKDQGYDVEVGRFSFRSLGKAMAINEAVGLVKIISEKKYGEILGAHIVGPHASDLIHEICVSIKLESTVEELMHTVHAHPSLSEAVMEAAQDVKGESVHK